MDIFKIAGVGILVSVTVWLTIQSYRFAKQYRSQFLYFQFLWIVFTFSFAFFDLIGRGFTRRLLDIYTPSSGHNLFFERILNLLAIPFLVLACYYFIKFFLSLIDKEFTLKYQIGYFSIQLIMTILYILFLWDLAHKGLDEFPTYVFILLTVFDFIIRIIYIVPLIIVLNYKGKDKIWRKGLRILSCICLIQIIMVLVLTQTGATHNIRYYSYFISSYLFPLLPFIYFRLFYNQYLRQKEIKIPAPNILNEFFWVNHITEREQEIVKLIMEGKSNSEIEQELFISIKTVKTHIYNIYKKVKVNTRYQLINLISHFESENQKERSYK